MMKAQLRELAEIGASVRARELTSQLYALHREFPALKEVGARLLAKIEVAKAKPSTKKPGKRLPGRRGWNKAQRKAAAERMRKYWAARKSAKKAGKKK